VADGEQGKGYFYGPYCIVLVILAALVALAAIGCSGHSRTSPGAISSATFVPTIEAAPPTIAQLLKQVAEARQLSRPESFKVGLVKRSDVPKLIDSLLSKDDRSSMAETTTLYRLLGHLSRDQEYLHVYESFVAQALVGVYSPKDKALWVVHPDGQPIDFSKLGAQEKQTLVHELVHAIQDTHFDLQGIAAKTGSSLDLGLAATTVIEGDAVSTQRDYDSRYTAISMGGTVILANVARLSAAAPASIQRELLFPYTQGSDWIAAIRQQGGNDAVDALLRNPPQGTVFVFHPDRLQTGWEPRKVALPDMSHALGDGWKRQSGGQFGQFELQNYLQLRLPGLDAVQGADGWAGDHYDVYVHDDESVAAFRIAFSSEDEARQFTSAQDALLKAEGAQPSERDELTLRSLADGTTTARLTLRDSSVTFVIGSTAGIAARAADALLHG
jgi:hypothetical protein